MSRIDQWHAHPELGCSPEDLLQQIRAAGAIYGGGPVCVHGRPHFVSRSLVRSLQEDLGVFHGIIRRLRKRLMVEDLDPEGLVGSLGTSPDALALARIDPGYDSASVIARVDTFVDQGVPRFLELNGESPAGIAYADALTQVFQRDPRAEGLVPMSSAPAVVEAVLQTWADWGGRADEPLVAIVDLDGVPTSPEFVLFRQHFRAMGLRCEVADPRDLRWDGRRLRLDGQPVDIVYRRILVADILQRPRACQALLEAYRAGAVCMVNSLRTVLLHGKGLFAVLHLPSFQAGLNARQRELIERSVPWTARMRPELLDRAMEQQQQLVLKPMVGHGGRGVLLGWQQDEASWRRALTISHDSHVLQERVRPQVLPFPDARRGGAIEPRMVDLAPFLVRGKVTGFLCRVSESELANVSTGGSQVPVFMEPA
jgi:uncharacterized circularly permuted ATP-grasp superfamily protein